MKLVSLFLGLLLAGPALAAMPDVLPYGTADLPIPPSPMLNQTDPKVVDLLGAQLSNPDPLQRARLLGEIGACRMASGAKYVRQSMSDPDPIVRAQAAGAAGATGDVSLVDDLKKLATDADPRVRVAVMESARQLGGDAVIAAGLADADAVVVGAAVAAALPGNADAVGKAIGSYPAGTQLSALRSLGRLAAAQQAGAIVPFLASNAVALRAASVEAIGQMKATAHAAAVDALLADKHATVRRSALTATANLVAAGEFQKRAITALADPDLSVRENAARLLAKSPTPDAIDGLAANLASESDRLHIAARDALVAVGPPAIPKAEQLMTDPDPRRREDASFVLGRLKSDAGLEKHIALLADKDWRIIRQAAESLGRIGRKEAVPELVRLANLAGGTFGDVPVEERLTANLAVEQAIVGCAYFDERSIIPTCRKVLPDKLKVSSSIRSGAVYALGRMDDPKGPVPGTINRILNDQEDAGDVKTEGLKALGHMKSSVAKSWVGTDRDSSKPLGDRYSDWIAHWVRFKLTGQDVPYDPLPDGWTAPVSIHLIK